MGQQEETRSIAAHDSLTKIYNFTAFCESSRKYLLSAGAGRSMGVIYANIIDFKSVNELYCMVCRRETVCWAPLQIF